jgi:hypothetical protein
MQYHRLISFIFALSLTTGAHALDNLTWPTTVDEAVRDLVSTLSIADKLEIQWTAKENIISLYSVWGLRIRNRYGLWRANDKLILSACAGPCHPDDASMRIIEALWRKLRE